MEKLQLNCFFVMEKCFRVIEILKHKQPKSLLCQIIFESIPLISCDFRCMQFNFNFIPFVQKLHLCYFGIRLRSSKCFVYHTHASKEVVDTHTCDYNSRLHFEIITRRMIEYFPTILPNPKSKFNYVSARRVLDIKLLPCNPKLTPTTCPCVVKLLK